MTSDQRRGTKALLLGLRLLMDIRRETGVISKMSVYISSQQKAAFAISYEKDLPDQFVIVQEYNREINKELQLHLGNVKDFLIDFIWRHKVVIEKITIKSKDTKPFYLRNFGVTWHSENCMECRSILKAYGINCVDVNCDYDMALSKLRKLFLRHHPDKGGDADIFTKLQQCRELVVDERCYENIRHGPVS
jgi:hypothetical protein